MEELHAETERLRLDFLNTDLDVAFTFVNLARRELELGECHHFDDLVDKSYRVVETVENLMKRLPEAKTRAIRKRLDELRAGLWKMETAYRGASRDTGRLPGFA